MNWWDAVLAIAGGLVLVYAVLLVLLASYARRHPETTGMKEGLRLLPDLLQPRGMPAGAVPWGMVMRLRRG
ncbi:hypothetical protein [Arthrobacter sp.]|uniref:hypothetical protein n=1 Tax=Arthrobacter sp. TaxID=1667 RepID=UPI003397BA13